MKRQGNANEIEQNQRIGRSIRVPWSRFSGDGDIGFVAHPVFLGDKHEDGNTQQYTVARAVPPFIS